MIVSWRWLADYLELPDSHEEVARRLALAGLNHESTSPHGTDWAIDLEVTSNRPDCLGHLGIAREITVLWNRRLQVPDPRPIEGTTPVTSLANVRIDAPELCPRYTARVIQGVRIAPSPAWLEERLRTVGVQPVNNVVDITNYVMLECGQPLHAFDLTRIPGGRIVVRDARPSETFLAIDHHRYALHPGMCVIAADDRGVALGGVMGGVDSEVSPSTRDLLIESAEFAPLAIRGTARALNLFSSASYRFERGLDPEGIDWASRRCCDLILKIAGGTLAAGVIDAQTVARSAPPPARLRWSQIPRVLGIEIPRDRATDILMSLGATVTAQDADSLVLTAPSWRRDLTREIDWIEEVARIHGYEAIPENLAVPMATSQRRHEDRVLDIVRQTLVAAGFQEALTASVVSAEGAVAIQPWSDARPLRTQTPMLRGADHLRGSLLPSLLGVRRDNAKSQLVDCELFEIAKAYLPNRSAANGLPDEPLLVGIVSGRGFAELKGWLETLLVQLGIGRDPSKPADRQLEALSCESWSLPLLHPGRTARLGWNQETFGLLGELNEAGRNQFELPHGTTVMELRLNLLTQWANLAPTYRPLPVFPAIDRDLNLIVDDRLRWSELAATVRDSAGDFLERLSYLETYRDPQRDGPGRKRLLFGMGFRSSTRTLEAAEVQLSCQRVIEACQIRHGAVLA